MRNDPHFFMSNCGFVSEPRRAAEQGAELVHRAAGAGNKVPEGNAKTELVLLFHLHIMQSRHRASRFHPRKVFTCSRCKLIYSIYSFSGKVRWNSKEMLYFKQEDKQNDCRCDVGMSLKRDEK